ncbi:hypothetical protein E1871_19595 [Salmonella enterica subsp. enterica serovar Mgulani]|uniref:hypothetical protein n=1 Tax=Citrobacter portucalensis TaxID=1639133 RepID=UPI0012809594|nr:hypothetical protein [Salmonella enterica]EBG4345978.1 hypothetical protein [Salmonella enterica]ECG8314198.1 hypothetical protein [Salmonella enterica subsp. enterica serovar Mgulani]
MSILSLNTADIFNAIGGGSPLSIIDSVLHPQYVIRYHDTSFVALEFSGMASIQPGGRAQITNAPIENGQYQSINKVKEPGVVRCSIIIKGMTGLTGTIPNLFDLTLTSQSEVLRTIQVMLKTTGLYDIETPKEILASYDLVDHDYEVNSQHGVDLLTVYLVFQEVMQQMEVTISGAQANKSPTNDKISQGVTGTGGFQGNAGATPSTVDQLGKSWSSLKKSLGDLSDSATGAITTGFKSALDTVSEPVLNVANSATEKAAELAGNISKNITGPSSK